MGRRNARGFTLVETLVAVAIAALVGWVLLHVLSQTLLVSRVQAARNRELAGISKLAADMTTQEDDAWAIYVPPVDALGNANADGHEVDFFTRDGKQQAYFWAYNFDASGKSITRYRFDAPGASAAEDATYEGIAAFKAATYPVTALQDPSTPVYSSLYDGANLQSGIVHFYPAMPWIAGGNNITSVQVEGATMRRDLELVTQTAPSGFTVVLSYTPSPAPSTTSTPAGLSVWPAAVRFPVAGSTIGAGCSTAIAYASTTAMNGDTPLANATDPYNAAITTDGTGCLSQAVVSLYEPNYTGTFADWQVANSPCSSANISEGGWNPANRRGPQAAQYITAGPSVTSSCYLGFEDVNSSPLRATVLAQVIEPCWEIGGACIFPASFRNDQPSCDPAGDTSGYTGSGIVTGTGFGALVNNGNGTYTFTRTSAGVEKISLTAQYESVGGSFPRCTHSFAMRPWATVTYQSV